MRDNRPKKYLIVIERARRGYSAYSPDVPGCIATGSTRERAERAMRKAIAFHLEGLRAEGERLPSPRSYSAYVDVPA
jgi:predicted RNase H-like HicB family nuclease